MPLNTWSSVREVDAQYRRLTIVRVLRMSTWGVALGMTAGWVAGILWLAGSLLYTSLRAPVERLLVGRFRLKEDRAELLMALSAVGVFAIAPGLSAVEPDPWGPMLALVMVGSGYYFLAAKYGGRTFSFLVASAPFSLVTLLALWSAWQGPDGAVATAAALVIASAVEIGRAHV